MPIRDMRPLEAFRIKVKGQDLLQLQEQSHRIEVLTRLGHYTLSIRPWRR